MKVIKLILFILSPAIFLFVSPAFILLLIKKPSNNREWELGQNKLASIVFDNDNQCKVKINNFRNFDWCKNQTNRWCTKDIDIKDITGLDVAVTHFGHIGHIFLIFNLINKKSVGVSIEARRDGGERFTIFGGLKFDYELIYIYADKQDLIDLRKKRNEKMYIYKTRMKAKTAQALFISFAHRTNKIHKEPEFYHLFFRNCANLITNELKRVTNKKFSFVDTYFFLPSVASRTLFNMGFIKTDKDNFKDVQKESLVRFDN